MTEKKHDIELIDEVVSQLKAQFDGATNNWTCATETAKAIGLLLNAKANIALSYNYSGVNSPNCGGLAVFGSPPKQG